MKRHGFEKVTHISSYGRGAYAADRDGAIRCVGKAFDANKQP